MTAQFAEGVTKVQDKHRVLEAENAWLKQTLTDLNDRFSKLGAVLASDSVPSCGQFSPSSTPPRSHNSPELHRCGKMPDVPAFPFPLPPTPVPAAAHQAADGGTFGYPEGIETPSSESPLGWSQAQVDQVGRAPRDSQTEEEWDEQQLLDLAMLHGGCPSILHAPPDYSLNGGGWYGFDGFAMRADASVFVPSVSVGVA